MMLLICSILTLVYLLLIGSFIIGFEKVKPFQIEDIEEQTAFSVVIPFRNEAKNLPALCDSLSKLDYPKHLLEILLVNDDSTDESVEILKSYESSNFNATILNNIRRSNSPKKDAIETAILNSKHPWIITTDADCQLPKYWLTAFDQFIQKNNSNLVAGPVTYVNRTLFLDQFQTLDFLSLVACTMGSFGLNKPFMCNGANLAYKKSLFKEVNGFKGHHHLGSGDDVFLLQQALKQNKESIHFLKCDQALVKTQPSNGFKALCHQRVRWASKTGYYQSWFGKTVGLVVFLMNFMIVLGIPFFLLGIMTFPYFLKIWFLKAAIDFLLLFKISRWTSQEHLLKVFVPSALAYPFFCSYTALLSLRRTYQWKGRVFKK